MNLAACLKRYLDHHKVSYRLLSHHPTVTLCEAAAVLDIHPTMMIRAVLLGDHKGKYLAVLPMQHKVDFARLKRLTGRTLRVLPRAEADRYFHDCEPGSHPPIGEPYNIPTLVDCAVRKMEMIYFEPGTHTAIVRMQQNDFHYLHANCLWGNFSVPVEVKNSQSSHWEPQPQLTQALVALHKPGIEAVGQRILSAYAVPKPDKKILRLLVSTPEQQQALLKTNVVPGSVQDKDLQFVAHHITDCNIDWREHPSDASIYDLLAHLYAAFEMARQFKVIENGPLAKSALFKQALYVALILHDLISQHDEIPLDASLGFKTGLYHNVGFLLLGHLFAPEYQMLNKMVIFNPTTSVNILEKRLVGMGTAKQFIQKGHAAIGAWLLEYWGASAPLPTITALHHRIDYSGPHEQYVRLLYWTDSLVRKLGLGEGAPVALPEPAQRKLLIPIADLEDWGARWIEQYEAEFAEKLSYTRFLSTDHCL